MATRSVTPGGALLRASRVFAIPPPLPRPAQNLSSTAIFTSDTATLPHPIRLSITTPQASLVRGDWGFKRPLPLRSTTKSSTPLIRVEAIDTYEHITEYASSADHTINMQKWLEMGVPLTVEVVDDAQALGYYQAKRRQSVFEDAIDYTTGPSVAGGKDDIRWKFKGPYLANQNEGSFVDYISTEVRKRKNEFQTYLRAACANDLTSRARIASTEEMPAAISADDITQEQLTSYIKELRVDRAELFKHIRAFLDLPPVAPPSAKDMQGLLGDLIENGVNGKSAVSASHFATTRSPYAATGPPRTHPSAGLSYTRSSAFTSNHPQFGPQKNSPPVKARVVRPKGGGGGSFGATLGVGGFVTDLPPGNDSFNLGTTSKYRDMSAAIPGALQIEPEKVGGSKTYVHPAYAMVNPKGQIVLSVMSGEPEAIAVLENTTDKIPAAPLPQKRVSSFGPRGATRSVELGSYGLSRDTPFAAPAANETRGDPVKALNGLLDISS